MNDENNLTQDQKTDMALILEGQLDDRVKKVVTPIIERTVVNIIGKEMTRLFEENKQKMQMEIAIQIGKLIGSMYEDSAKPLWEYKPEDFGLTHQQLNTHHIEKAKAGDAKAVKDDE